MSSGGCWLVSKFKVLVLNSKALYGLGTRYQGQCLLPYITSQMGMKTVWKFHHPLECCPKMTFFLGGGCPFSFRISFLTEACPFCVGSVFLCRLYFYNVFFFLKSAQISACVSIIRFLLQSPMILPVLYKFKFSFFWELLGLKTRIQINEWNWIQVEVNGGFKIVQNIWHES